MSFDVQAAMNQVEEPKLDIVSGSAIADSEDKILVDRQVLINIQNQLKEALELVLKFYCVEDVNWEFARYCLDCMLTEKR